MKAALTCMLIVTAAALLVAFAPPAEADIGCGTVASYISSCLPYVTGQGPLGGCCDGVKGLNAAATTTPDRQAVCGCLKSLAGSNSGVDPTKAAQIPGECGVSLPYPISASTDCSKVQ